MTKIYIVLGTTGQFSDRSEWVVCAYTEEQKARAHVEAATVRANEIEAALPSRYGIPSEKNEFDPNMEMYENGTRYFLSETELRP